MNLNKHIDFFNPIKIDKPIHIVGVGAVGSRIAEQLTRLGIEELNIYDFDKVEDVNITNQAYLFTQIGMSKVDALEELLKQINPQIKINKYPEGYKEGTLNGYVFMAVDSVKVRQEILNNNMFNLDLEVIFDVRMRLTDAQSYAANWNILKQKNILIQSLDFTEEEAKAATPVSACGTTLSVSPLVTTLAALTVSNFMNHLRSNKLQNVILMDVFEYNIAPIAY